MAVVLTPGQAGDNPQLLPLLQEISVARTGPGRPRQRPDRVVADKAYSHPSTRPARAGGEIASTGPGRSTRTARRRPRAPPAGRPPPSTTATHPGAKTSNPASPPTT